MSFVKDALNEMDRVGRDGGDVNDFARRREIWEQSQRLGKVEMVERPDYRDPAGTGLVLICSGCGPLLRVALPRHFVLELLDKAIGDPR